MIVCVSDLTIVQIWNASGPLGPFVLSIFTAWLASMFTVKAVLKQKAWDKKETVYHQILQDLEVVASYSDLLVEQYIEDASSSSIPEENVQALKAAKERLECIMNGTTLHVTDETVEVLRSLRDNKHPISKHSEPYVNYQLEAKTYRDAIDTVRIIAKKKLKIK